MADGGAGPAGEHRGHPAAFVTQAGVTDGVDAAVHPVQAAPARALARRRGVDSERLKLLDRDDSMLASRQPGKPVFDLARTLRDHVSRKVRKAPGRPLTQRPFGFAVARHHADERLALLLGRPVAGGP